MPFQPVAGLHGSDIPAAAGLRALHDPFTGERVYVVPRLQPDWAILHVQEADAAGNARIYGSVFWDRIMSRAARGVILTTERVVSSAELARLPELTVIPGLLVRAVVEAPGGAWPGSCTPCYDIDRVGVEAYLRACGDPVELAAHLEHADAPHARAHRVAAPRVAAEAGAGGADGAYDASSMGGR